MTGKAAVLGSPIAHSRSPQLHLAAYRALGLEDWTYERIECGAAELPALVAALDTDWVGVSVTMPGKFAALGFADDRTARAELVGSANTLVRTESGWLADNTDVDGVMGAVGSPVTRAAIIGSGGTAPAALLALRELGAQDVTIVSRNSDRAAPLLALGARIGTAVRWVEWGTPSAAVWSGVDLAVSTIPAAAAAAGAAAVSAVPVLLDAIYDPWPTPLAAAVTAAGGRVIDGLQMLLHQAFAQVELFTGRPAPKEAMRAALAQR